MSCLSSVVLTKQTDFFARGCPRGETEKAALPVTEVVHCTVWVAGTGLAATGAICEVILLAVLTLQTSVALHTRTLTGALVTVVGMWNPLKVTAAVTKDLWVSGGWGVTKKTGKTKKFKWRMKDNSSESRSVLTTLHKMMNIVFISQILFHNKTFQMQQAVTCVMFKTGILKPFCCDP